MRDGRCGSVGCQRARGCRGLRGCVRSEGTRAGSGRAGVTKFLDDLRARSGAVQERVPPGQVVTAKWPVLHYGDVPRVDTKTWTFEVSGLVAQPFTLTYDELLALPRRTVRCDIHCVTRWSRLDNAFAGVPVQLLLERAGVGPEASHCLVLAEQGFTTNLPLTDLARPENLIALRWCGEWLTPEHGWPARLLVPHLY